jgi:hypothetical protein
VSADPFGGWGTMILQAGAFGLLTYVVVFMYPRASKEAREERESRDQLFSGMVHTLQEKFEERNEKIVASVEKQTQALSTTFNESASRIEQALAAVCRLERNHG